VEEGGGEHVVEFESRLIKVQAFRRLNAKLSNVAERGGQMSPYRPRTATLCS
jgi:hypothetical protein